MWCKYEAREAAVICWIFAKKAWMWAECVPTFSLFIDGTRFIYYPYSLRAKRIKEDRLLGKERKLEYSNELWRFVWRPPTRNQTRDFWYCWQRVLIQKLILSLMYPHTYINITMYLTELAVVQKAISLIQDYWKFCGQNYKDVDKDVWKFLFRYTNYEMFCLRKF